MEFQQFTPCLWFDSEAEEAVNFYVSVFKNSSIGEITYFGTEGYEFHGKDAGTVMTVTFTLNGQTFMALNGGPIFKFSEAISFVINCQDQQEVDYFWQKLGDGGDPNAQQCGWLKDKYGLSWQVVPIELNQLMQEPDAAKRSRVLNCLYRQKKIDLAELKQAREG